MMKKLSLLFVSVSFATCFCTAQNVGIGTTAPGAKLHVNGTFKITDGTQASGKVLTSDANGLTSWKTATAATSINSDSSFLYGQQTGTINSYNLGGGTNISSDSSGYLYDSGGPNGNYGNNESHSFNIDRPLGAIQLRVQFISFATESPYDSLAIYKNNSLFKSYSGTLASQRCKI